MVYKHRTKAGKVRHYQSREHYERSLKGYFASQNKGNKVGRAKARTKHNATINRRMQYKTISGKMKHRSIATESLKALNNDLRNLEFLIKEEVNAQNSDPKFLRKLRSLFAEIKIAFKIVQLEKATEERKEKGKKMKHKVAFVTETDTLAWINEGVKEWGGENEFYLTKEYHDEFHMLKKLWDWEEEAKQLAFYDKLTDELNKRSLSTGDNVFMDYISKSGTTTFKGNITMIGGKPHVKLPDGRDVLWHIGWKKSSSIKGQAPPVFDKSDHNQLYARRLAIEKFLKFSQEQQEKDLGENAPVIFNEPTQKWFDDPKAHDIEDLDTKTSAVFGKTNSLKAELTYLPRKPKGKK